MKVEVKKLPKSEVQLTITVPYSTYRKWEEKALKDLSGKVKVAGFRPGNIPEEVIRQNVEPHSIMGATLDYVLPQTYSEAIREHDLQVVSQPKVDLKKPVEKEGDDLIYEAIVAVLPEVKMGDYKKIKVARKPVKVEKKNVDETIAMVIDRFAEWKDVDRPAKQGDRAELTFEGFDEDGVAIPNTNSKNHPLILGSKSFVPGFEEEVEGMKVGDSKEFTVTFPKDYHAKPMQNKKVTFKVTLNRLEEKHTPELNEALIEKVTGEKKSVEDFRKQVEEDLLREMENRARADHDNTVVAEVIKITKAELPEAIIEQELDIMLDEQKHKVKHQGLEWEHYLEHIKKTEEDFRKDHRKGAEERLLARLGIQHIIKDAGIQATDQETNEKIEEMVSKYPEAQAAQLRDHYLKDGQAFRHLKYSLAADKLIEMLTK